jgi:hypothetical protein
MSYESDAAAADEFSSVLADVITIKINLVIIVSRLVVISMLILTSIKSTRGCYK